MTELSTINKITTPDGITYEILPDESISATNDSEGNQISTTYETKTKNITTLSSSGTISLTDNSINKITSSGTITFSLPSISNSSIFHQILVQLTMNTVVTINLGTTYFFNAETPDLSSTGTYNIIYEYDGSRWVCGAIKKGVAS